jgi:hypothetical protein
VRLDTLLARAARLPGPSATTAPTPRGARPGSKKVGVRKMVANPPETSTGANHTGMTLARTRSMLNTTRPLVKTRVERDWNNPPHLGSAASKPTA